MRTLRTDPFRARFVSFSGLPSGFALTGAETHRKHASRTVAYTRAMPLINIYTSAEPPPADVTDALLAGLSGALARHFSKPESYVMTCLVPRTQMTFGGTKEPACYAEVKNVGELPPAGAEALSEDL